MLRSKFVKFLMSIFKRQVSSSSIFVSFFIVMTHNPSVIFQVIHFLLWAKGSHQSSNFDTFECSGENLPNSSCHFPSNKSVFLHILHHCSLSWKITPLYFLAQTIYTLLKRSPLKWKFLRLSSAQVKICQIPVNFETISWFLSKFCISSVSWKITPQYFFSSNNIYFARKEPIKVKMFETFGMLTGQNLSNSLCQFWNDKSIPLQILYPSPVSWKITPLYVFSSNNIYFAQKGPIKMKTFKTLKCSGENLSNSFCQLWNDKSVLFKFCVILHCHDK